ncbi:MAG: hypothetical protein HZA22_02005 [Nitrospirae bacterium]|nr:hypothetical protein [Nitrospirota bacterium]
MRRKGLGVKFIASAAASAAIGLLPGGAALVIYGDGLSVTAVSFLALLGAGLAVASLYYAFGLLVIGPLSRLSGAVDAMAGTPGASQDSGRDELDAIRAGLDRLAGRMAGIGGEVERSSADMLAAADGISARCREVIDYSETQIGSVETVTEAMRELNGSGGMISENVERVMSVASESAVAVSQLAASVEDVSSSAGALFDSIVESASMTDSMAMSIVETAGSVDQLAALAKKTNANIESIQVSFARVDKNTRRSAELAEEVVSDAETGKVAVQQTIEGMERIREEVEGGAEMVRRLGRSSKAIDEINKVIAEVSEKTNLLALNAAIIAAQAGEQGRSFAVVADEIKELAERTGVSTKEIVKIIKAVQRDVTLAVRSMESGQARVEEGVVLTARAGEALGKIIEGVVISKEVTGEIASATAEQVDKVMQVSQAVAGIAEMTSKISGATQEQARSAEGVMLSASKIKELSMALRKSTVEQAKGSRRLKDAVGQVSEMTGQMRHAVKTQLDDSARIEELVARIQDSVVGNVDLVARMNDGVEVLTSQARSLGKKASELKS